MATQYSNNYEPDETYIKFVCPECGFSDYTNGEPVCTRCGFGTDFYEPSVEQESVACL